MQPELFNPEEHQRHRAARLAKVSIENPKLLGLATVEINPTELCNRTCSFCPRHDPEVYPNRKLHMTVETASLLSDQLHSDGFNGEIHITGYGEPLLDPDTLLRLECLAGMAKLDRVDRRGVTLWPGHGVFNDESAASAFGNFLKACL